MIIRVHCFVSCLCDVLRRYVPTVDQRPLYFGVWDADFSVTNEAVLSYHSPSFDQRFLRSWFERLYGVEIARWYDDRASKEQNLAELDRLLSTRTKDTEVIAMLDLHVLPERENKYNQDPFPHYVMLERTDDPEIWFMRDPDFSWEGRMSKRRIQDAIRRPSVAGGFILQGSRLKPPAHDDVAHFFSACFLPSSNPLTAATRFIVETHLARGQLSELNQAVRELPVLAVRKYAYEHGFAYFFRAMKLHEVAFERWCETIDALVRNYTALHYQIVKLSISGQRSLAGRIFSLLDEQDALEFRIKSGLQEINDAWKSGRAPLVRSEGTTIGDVA